MLVEYPPVPHSLIQVVMRVIKKVSLSVFVLSLVSMIANAAQFKVGEPFPNILLPSLDDGTAQSIENFRGQKLMLHIFASW